ncbi:MAG TPA: nucleotidyltransferase family protein [Gaiellaceae bacterium]|nr:nucleotidyltransferase family protein [Gaiellaceae bacterium]
MAASALRLAAGRATERDLSDAPWPALHDVARRERLAPLAWLRSGALLAAAADEETSAAWRQDWCAAAAAGYRRLALAGELTAAAAKLGAEVVVLKGAPLSQRLYGDPSARPSTDLDVFVESGAAAAAAAEAAVGLGWRQVDGSAGADAAFARDTGDGVLFLELHTTLLGERLGFLPVPAPRAAAVVIDGVALRVHDDALLPAYLAAHLATHSLPPLLWWLDWHTLWTTTSDAQRDQARRAAGAAGLARYLRWAERACSAIAAALDGDDDALAAVGFRARGPRTDVHQLVRHVALAPTPRIAAAAVREWIRPSWAAERDGSLVGGTLRRVARHWRLLLPAAAPDARGDSIAPRAQRIANAADMPRIRAVVAAGGEVWLPVGGRSMTPTIGVGDSVLLTRPSGPLRAGDIVLSAGTTLPMLHRVAGVEADRVVTVGDACDEPDAPVAPEAIVARAVAVRRGGVVAALTPTLRFGVGPLVRFCVRAVRRPRRARPPKAAAR